MISVLIKSVMSFATKLLMSFASEELLKWAFFYFAEKYVESTKTPHDDEFLEEVAKSYNKKYK